MAALRCLSPEKLTPAKRRRLRREAVQRYFSPEKAAEPVVVSRKALLHRRIFSLDIKCLPVDELSRAATPSIAGELQVGDADVAPRHFVPPSLHQWTPSVRFVSDKLLLETAEKAASEAKRRRQVHASSVLSTNMNLHSAHASSSGPARALSPPPSGETPRAITVDVDVLVRRCLDSSGSELQVDTSICCFICRQTLDACPCEHPFLIDYLGNFTEGLYDVSGHSRQSPRCVKCHAEEGSCACWDMMCKRCWKRLEKCGCAVPRSKICSCCQVVFDVNAECCPNCGEAGYIEDHVQLLDHEYECSVCETLRDQDDIVPCDSCDGADFGDSEKRFMGHIGCMTRVEHPGYDDDAYLCPACVSAGRSPQPIDGDDEEDDESNASSDSDTDYRTVSAYGSISVGMPFRGGTVKEIYPGLDKFTVSRRVHNGTQIDHLRISKYETVPAR